MRAENSGTTIFLEKNTQIRIRVCFICRVFGSIKNAKIIQNNKIIYMFTW